MKAIRSILAAFLAILVVISSTSFVVGMHICMGKVQNVAFFQKAESCKNERSAPAAHSHMRPSCCQDEVVYHEGSDFKASVEQIHITVPAPIEAEYPLLLISEIIPDSPLSRIRFYNYDPPIRSFDLTIEHQAFLI